MNETKSRGHGVAVRYMHFIDRLSLRIVRAIGTPPLGPEDQVVKTPSTIPPRMRS
ncbi:hypothetical protein [Cryobacterium algoritolerans]|uniref:hypothetical protein n=1 Tax=Cryobacterium algoritolerans TaxID=1259184 RepID=UPI00141BD530|nr:hypothetical protein [Cryobacterium algoritolerans]